MARLLHDRFCKFNIPYKAADVINIVRSISQIIPLDELKAAKLSFKLNSLRWFLTPGGKIFLEKARKRYQLDEKLDKLDLNKNPAQLNQIAPKLVPSYPNITEEEKFGADHEFVKQMKTVSEFLS